MRRTVSEGRLVLAIDPGPKKSGFVVVRVPLGLGLGRLTADEVEIVSAGEPENDRLIEMVDSNGYWLLAAEDMCAMGRPFGASIAETCRMIGRLEEAFRRAAAADGLGDWETRFVLLNRPTVSAHVSGSRSARDPDIREALTKIWGERGTKAKPGPLYRVTGHALSALAVASAALGIHERHAGLVRFSAQVTEVTERSGS